jgi:hypothetical protein
MSAPGTKPGFACVAYLNTNTYASPSWSPITAISDFNVAPKFDAADAPSRISRIKLTIKTLMALEIGGKLKASDVNDANYTTIRAALITDVALDLMILNGSSSTNGATGFRCGFQVHDATEDQGLGVQVYDDVVFKPCPNTDGNYNSVLVATGAPVFTAL